MLTFKEKLAIIETFPELTRHDISMGRVNYHFEDSVLDKKIVVYRLHPNGNGFVYAEQLDGTYPVDEKGMVNIREFTKEELQEVIASSISSLSKQETFIEVWRNSENEELLLRHDFDSWNVYTGDMLEATFATYDAARDYLEQEGFKRPHKNI
ncbi:hypothetical protein ACFSMW_00625 [Virgibacillus halophilus]|uniref:Phage protein n=1 Tax=Tigheibacillus halophilus TaxID=361280 RepID=A0ABU5C942_9BACI|nr:hypothetical protein [Virgibacillus halophilus]